ncbi:hypothetical protein B566_EDAN001076 [Ephemera danica]|nr:hypothetical protein B566_EDAN001076 [Ephemera danica]
MQETDQQISSNTRSNSWRKVRTQKGVAVPRGRRGHSALVYQGAMLVYGGYQDLRGSSSDLWVFDFERRERLTETSRDSKGCSKLLALSRNGLRDTSDLRRQSTASLSPLMLILSTLLKSFKLD